MLPFAAVFFLIGLFLAVIGAMTFMVFATKPDKPRPVNLTPGQVKVVTRTGEVLLFTPYVSSVMVDDLAKTLQALESQERKWDLDPAYCCNNDEYCTNLAIGDVVSRARVQVQDMLRDARERLSEKEMS